jgi:hypothetical protein
MVAPPKQKLSYPMFVFSESHSSEIRTETTEKDRLLRIKHVHLDEYGRVRSQTVDSEEFVVLWVDASFLKNFISPSRLGGICCVMSGCILYRKLISPSLIHRHLLTYWRISNTVLFFMFIPSCIFLLHNTSYHILYLPPLFYIIFWSESTICILLSKLI